MSRKHRHQARAITVTFTTRVLWYVDCDDGSTIEREIQIGERISGVPRAHVVEGNEVFDLLQPNGALLRCVPYDAVTID